MSYLKFDKSQLINLEYSLNKEVIRSNRAGSYACTTIIVCNTRKYHGSLVVPVENFDGEQHVLLSTLDVSIIQNGQDFNLGIHKYQGDLYIPKGHKYVRDFEINSIPKLVYRVGGVVLTRESILVEKEEQILIKYTFVEADKTVKLRFTPFLAFRNIHSLSKVNMHANTKVKRIKNGVKSRLYDGYPYLNMQFSKTCEFIQMPDWYYNIEYLEEQKRGYDFKEDLFVPGYFEMSAKKGESIIFSASTREANPEALKRKFSLEHGKRVSKDNFRNCLINAAEQFFNKKGKKVEIIAGFPWFGSWGRDTFISLPGLSLSLGNTKLCKEVIDSMVAKLKNGLFPNMDNEDPAYNTVDASLWFFWALQQYTKAIHSDVSIWTQYNKAIKEILNAYRKGTMFGIKMDANGLMYAGEPGRALTWMDAVVNGKPVTQRKGYPVEINALWYNAVVFSLDLAKQAGDNSFISKWKNLPPLIKDSFIKTFWDEKKGYLADVVDGDFKDWSLRPNQIIALSVDNSPVDDEIYEKVLRVVDCELLTPRGLRTLSPKNEHYIGVYEGNQEKRDSAYHQGTVWPWLIEHFCRAYIKKYKSSGVPFLKKIVADFEPVVNEHGLGTISEIYDGDPPHHPRGAISQAWSVAALLNVLKLIDDYSEEN
ncbi:MAG: glycogen debranching enzyme family protein [Bacteroidales bacterium]|nr:glycogen debranching enzyme family protein [Bacteroidales bacterium]